jgi:site-specific DNA-methyltransferase (adenine-specific)/modification methylase
MAGENDSTTFVPLTPEVWNRAITSSLQSTSGGAMKRREETLGEGVRLILGDCRDVLPTLGFFDACVTDPPYGIGENEKKVASRSNAAAAKDYGAFDWDRQPITATDVAALRGASRHQIIFGGNFFEGLGPTPCWLVWDKQNTGDFADCELAWTNLKKAVRRIYWRWNGMIRKGNDVREHPTQKPVGVMEWCISQLPDSDRVILDPFMGSGTTGVAAVNLGRHFVGIEREERYFDIACRRIAQAMKQHDSTL